MKKEKLIRALPTLLITAVIITCYAARDSLTKIIDTNAGILFGNLIPYLILSVPIILFLPFYVQLLTFILCSLLGFSAHMLIYLAGYKYAERVEGVSATVFGTFISCVFKALSLNKIISESGHPAASNTARVGASFRALQN